MFRRSLSFRSDNAIAAAQVLILTGICVSAFWELISRIARYAPHSGDRVHSLAVPVAIAALLYRRRGELSASLGSGSWWGVFLVLAGLVVYALSIWPFNYGYPRDLAIVPVLGGVFLAVGGWRFLKRCGPVLLLVFLAIPIGSRIYSRLIIKPENLTVAATAKALDALPGVNVEQVGIDLVYSRADTSGTVALGEPARGAKLLLAYAVIGVFVVFCHIRPLWQVIFAAIMAVPIVFLCNFLRLLCMGVVTVYGQLAPVSAWPRNVAAAVSLLAAYGLFVALCALEAGHG